MSKMRIRSLVLAVAALGLLSVPVGRGAAQSTLSAWMHCEAIDYDRLLCNATPSGGGGSLHLQLDAESGIRLV
jgi:hypothetical protein